MESAHLSTGFISKLGAFLKAYTVIRPIRRLPEVPLPGGEHPNGEAEIGDAVGQDTRLEAPRAVPEQVVRDPRHRPYQPLRVFGREETRRDQERDPRERPRRDRLEVGPDQPPDQEAAPEELLRDRTTRTAPARRNPIQTIA